MCPRKQGLKGGPLLYGLDSFVGRVIALMAGRFPMVNNVAFQLFFRDLGLQF